MAEPVGVQKVNLTLVRSYGQESTYTYKVEKYRHTVDWFVLFQTKTVKYRIVNRFHGLILNDKSEKNR